MVCHTSSRLGLAPQAALRQHRLTCHAVRAPKAAPPAPKNPVGIHSQVWVGGWNPQQAETSIAGTKKAGYDLIEREAPPWAGAPQQTQLGRRPHLVSQAP